MSDFELLLTADSRGLVSGDRALDQIASTADKTERQVTRATGVMSKGMDQVGRQSIFASQQMRLTSMQLSQVAQQASATGNWVQALAIQLPDLALGFGPIGILAGAAAGALLPLAANLVLAQDEAEDLAKIIKDLEGATEEYEQAVVNASLSGTELVARFGEQAEGAQEVYDALRQIAELKYYESLQTAQTAISEAMSKLSNTVEHVRSATTNMLPQDAIVSVRQDVEYLNREFGLTLIQANSINNALDDLASAKGPADAAQAARDFSEAINQAAAKGAKITPQMRAVQQEVLRTYVEASRFTHMLGQANGQAGALAGTISGVADQAARATSIFQAMAAAGGAITASYPSQGVYGGIVRSTEGPMQGGSDPDLPLDGPVPQSRGTPELSGFPFEEFNRQRRGSSRTPAISQAERESKAVGDLIKELHEELSLVNAGDDAKRAAAASRQAGSAATSDERKEIISLTEAIYQEEQARNRAIDQMDEYKEATSSILDDVRSALDDGKISWSEWADIASNALDKVVNKLQDDLLDSLFSANKGSTGGGGWFSSLFGMFGGGGFASLPAVGPVPASRPSFDGGGYTGSGARAGGLDGKGGFMAMLHPQETVVDHSKGGSGVHVTSDVRVSVDQNGNLQAYVERTSTEIADQRSAANIRQYDGEKQNLYANGHE